VGEKKKEKKKGGLRGRKEMKKKISIHAPTDSLSGGEKKKGGIKEKETASLR